MKLEHWLENCEVLAVGMSIDSLIQQILIESFSEPGTVLNTVNKIGKDPCLKELQHKRKRDAK